MMIIIYSKSNGLERETGGKDSFQANIQYQYQYQCQDQYQYQYQYQCGLSGTLLLPSAKNKGNSLLVESFFRRVLEIFFTDIPLDHLCCIYWDCQTAKRTFLNGYAWELWLRNENWNTFVHHRHYYNISIWCLWCIWCIWCIWRIRCIWCIWCIWWIFQQYGWLVQWLMPD